MGLSSIRPSTLLRACPAEGDTPNPARTEPSFTTDSSSLQAKFDGAVEGLKKNLRLVFDHSKDVLTEGATYTGIWLESGPQEGLLYAQFNPAVGLSNHRVFFDLQRPDGYLPCCVRLDRLETSQIQMVVPIAATALELAEKLRDEEFLSLAYHSSAAWDDWLMRYRNTRGTGLCEAFCGFDTGEDKSPRFKGVPWKCPHDDARICPKVKGLPYLSPDLSATVYGGRLALATMARRLGKRMEADEWEEKAESIRRAILKWCFDPNDVSFYDRNAENQFVRIRCVELLVTLGEHVPDRKLFEEIYRRHIRNPREFWTPYPFPSVAADDPEFDHTMPHDSWGGPSQVLTALRAPRWMEYYGKYADLTHVMLQWVRATLASPHFEQQLNPWTGAFSTGHAYSPGMLLLVDFVARLYGVRDVGQLIEWNCRLPEGAKRSQYTLPTRHGTAVLSAQELTEAQQTPTRTAKGASSELTLGGKKLLTVRGYVRVIADEMGKLLELVGTEPSTQNVVLNFPEGYQRSFELRPDKIIPL